MPKENHESTQNENGLLLLSQKIATICAVVSLFGFVICGIVYGAEVLLVIFAGLLFAVFLRALSEAFHKYTGLGKTWSLVVVMIFLTLMTVASGWLLLPKLVGQVQELRQQLPESLSKLRQHFGDSDLGAWVLEREPFFLRLVPEPSSIMSRTTGAMTSAIGTAGITLMIFYIGLMLAAQPEMYKQGILHFFSELNAQASESCI